MSEENRAVANRWFREVWNERRGEVIRELQHPELIGHTVGAEYRGPEGFESFRADFLDAVPDLKIDVEGTAAEGDHVVVRWFIRGTHSGEGLGIPASGREIAQRGMTWLRIVDGQIVEGWDCWNLGGLLAELSARGSAN
ncbi:MAG: ester cyclase [Acidobacteriota bacterium]